MPELAIEQSSWQGYKFFTVFLKKMIMDYYQITERYRKREFRSQFSWLIRTIVMGLMLWVGWFWGNSTQDARISVANDQIAELQVENNRLAQDKTTLTNQLNLEREKRISAELVNETGDDKVAMRRLKRIVANHLARGVDEDQIRLALQSASQPSRCRPLEEKDLAVATSFFAGKEANTDLLDGAIRVFVEGEAHQEATKERPWFDAKKPVSMRVSYLSGEKIITETLPLTMNLLADSWLLQIKLKETSLKGYVSLNMNKCSFN